MTEMFVLYSFTKKHLDTFLFVFVLSLVDFLLFSILFHFVTFSTSLSCFYDMCYMICLYSALLWFFFSLIWLIFWQSGVNRFMFNVFSVKVYKSRTFPKW